MRKSEVKRLLGRLGCRWDDNIKIDLERVWTGLFWLVSEISGWVF
jgi:hypothetical protein